VNLLRCLTEKQRCFYFEKEIVERIKVFMKKVCSLILLLSPLMLFAQIPTQQSLQNQLEQYASNFPQEKIYIQFDKPAYAPGETIWYKIYLFTGETPSGISANVYVDLANDSGNILSHAVIPVIQASAKGNYDIPSSYKGRNLRLKAYTKWMLNFDSSFLFEKTLHIIQTKASVVNASARSNKPSVQFFPEGGDYISGIDSKVAFKAIYPDGKPCNIKGNIVNSKGTSVAQVNSLHDGMGFFYLLPEPGEKYTAQWKDERGELYQTALPAAKETGVHLEVKIESGKRSFIIKRSEKAPANFTQLHVVATMDQHLAYMASVKLDASVMIGGSIPVSELPSGVLQITLFDSNWIAIAERITFINNDNYHFEPEVGFASLGTGKRGKNTLVINVPDSLEANLSVAVTDAGIGIDSTDNIIAHLLLTGELKGKVFNPGYYFTDTSDTLQEQLDLVMLTNGWRRMKWYDIVNGKTPVIKYPNDTSYLTLSGKVFGATASDLRESALLLLILDHGKDSTRQAVQTYLQKDGTFSEPDYVMFDTTKIYYQLAGKGSLTGSSAVTFNSMLSMPRQVFFDKNGALYFSDSATENRNRYFAEEQARLAKFLEGTTLAAVTVKAKTKSPAQVLDEKYTSGLFSGGQAIQFDVLNDPAGHTGLSVLTYLQGKVAGLMITAPNTGGSASVTWRGGTPSFYLDETPVNIDQLSNLSMTQVAYVKVFQPPFFGAFGGGANGAIAVYTQKGGSVNDHPGKGLPFKVVIGYAPEKEFYSPNYGTFDQRNDLEDLRSTLYWNPMIITTRENHIMKFTFYNNDITNSFRVIVEGVNKDGQLTHIEKVIE
jgi:hypothetical protein